MSSKAKTTPPKPDGKPALVPKLRFPEFRDAAGWREGRIADIAISESSKLALNKLSLKPEGFSVYGADSCVGFIDSFDQAEEYIAIVKDGSGVGRLSLKQGESSVLGTLAYIKCKPSSRTKLTWLYYCLNSLDLRKFIKGSGIPHIYFSDYATHEVLIPSVPEQQKIAECLSSVDELIAAQTRKLDALKTHKKALMQQLFPREGETQPRLRFPEFQNAGEWEEIELGEKVDLLSGYPFDGPDISQDSNGIRLLRGINVTEGRIRRNSEIDRYYTGSTDGLEKFRVQTNDLVIGMDGSKVGKNSALVLEADSGALLIQRVARLRAKNSTLIQFIFQRINSPAFHSYVDRINTSSGIPHISAKQIKEFRICFPSDPEQHRIADCLTSLDDLIAAQTQKLDALKTHKKGLMQQLFPSPEEVEA